MNSEEWFKEKLERFKDDVDFLTEKAILDFTEQVVSRMEENGITRAELARRLNVSKVFITKLLNGNPNLTIKTMVSLARILDRDLKVELRGERDSSLEDLLAAISPEYLASIIEARADYRSGKVRTHAEVFGG